MKKINVGGAVAPPAQKGNGHARVEIMMGSRLEQLLSQYAVIHPQAKQLKAQDTTLSRDIAGETRPLFWRTHAGVVPESSSLLAGVGGDDFKLVVKDQYPTSVTDEGTLHRAIGKEKAEKYFHWATSYKLDFDQVPEDKQEALADHIEAFRAANNLPAGAITAKQYLTPNKGFHQQRTIVLTFEENCNLDAVMPVRSNPLL